jgi:tetratricopeptide (TPR) repeat protein
MELARATEPGRAWSIAFGDLDLTAVDRDLYRFFQYPAHTELTLPLASSHPSVVVAPLDAAGGHVAQARVAFAAQMFNPDKPGVFVRKATDEIAAALAVDPTNADALDYRPYSDANEQLRRVEAAARAHPQDAKTLHLLGNMLGRVPGRTAEREEAYRRTLAITPKDAWALNSLAWLLLDTGRAPAALPYAVRAHKRAPWAPDILDTYARAFFDAGSCARAGTPPACRRRVSGPRRRAGRIATAMKQRLATYEQKCGPVGTAP